MMGVKCIYSWNWPKNSTFLHQFPRNRSKISGCRHLSGFFWGAVVFFFIRPIFFPTKVPWPLALRVGEPFPAQLGWVPTPLSQKLPKSGLKSYWNTVDGSEIRLGNYKVCIKPVINNGEINHGINNQPQLVSKDFWTINWNTAIQTKCFYTQKIPWPKGLCTSVP